MTAQFDDIRVLGDAYIGGEITPKKSKADILVQSPNSVFDIPFENWRVWDAYGTLLPGTPANDDMGLLAGVHGTGSVYLETPDGKAATQSYYARQQVRIPHNWDAGTSLSLAIFAGLMTTLSDGTATLDVRAWKSNREGGLSGSDVIATNAIDINSLTLSERVFEITPTTLVAGDLLDVLLDINISDTSTVTAVTGRIGDVRFLVDTL